MAHRIASRIDDWGARFAPCGDALRRFDKFINGYFVVKAGRMDHPTGSSIRGFKGSVFRRNSAAENIGARAFVVS